MTDPLFLGIDGGGTACKARLCDADGTILAEAVTGPANTLLGSERAMAEINLATHKVLELAGLPQDRVIEVHVGAGLAGLSLQREQKRLSEIPTRFAGFTAHTDAYIACLGANGGEDGGILIAGTGSCAALIDKGADPEMTVELSNRSMRLYVPSSSLARVIVENVDYDQRTKRFSAFVSTPDSKSTRVTGRLQKMLSVPVTNRRMLKGELIGSQDIVWIKTPSERIQPDIVMHPDDLIGKTPKRGLRSGSPIRSSDVQRPVIVKKGSLVTMILKTPMMTLTSQGQAIDNGSDGDVIRLTNTQSNTVIQAVVSGPGVVTITPASHLAMN